MELALLLGALTLGFLAFFEPCTIATHTLFSVRLHQSTSKVPSLLMLNMARFLLLLLLFSVPVLFIGVPTWGLYLPSIALSVMALVYVVSRFVYLPIPHFAFYKLLPNNQNLPDAIKLGLTLPACTLPLVVILMALNATLHNLSYAVFSAALFTLGFFAPILLTVYKGVSNDGKQLLNRAAKGSPYLTAFLLIGFAIYLVFPDFRTLMSLLKSNLETASWTGLFIAFFAGFIFSFNPVSFASIPVMLAYVTKTHNQKRAIILATAFIVGTLLTHVALGVIMALGGDWIKTLMGRHWGLFLGPILITMGLMWSGWITIRLPWIGMRGKVVNDIWGAFLLGIPFSIAVCPFCTPALMVTLTASAAIGSVSFGAALLFSFALGRSIPIILGAWGMGWLESLSIMTRYQKPFEMTAGMVLIASGLYLINEYFLIIRF